MTLHELEKTISELTQEELAQFREWFLAFDVEIVDYHQVVKNGKETATSSSWRGFTR